MSPAEETLQSLHWETSGIALPMRIEILNLLIGAFVSASLGVAALLRNWRSRLNISFGTLCALIFVHDVMALVEDVAGTSAMGRAHTLVTLAIGPSLLLFLREFLPEYDRRIKKVLSLYLSLGLVIFLFLSFKSQFGIEAPLWLFAHLSPGIAVFLWTYFLTRNSRTLPFPRARLRARSLSWGAVLVVLFYTTDALQWSFANQVPPLGALARSLFLFFVFQTIIQKEILTTEEVLTKAALFSGVALVLSIIYLLLVNWVGHQPGLIFFNTFIASFVVIVLFDPIRKFTALLVRRLFLSRHLILEEGLENLSRELVGVVDPRELYGRIHSLLTRSLGVEGSELFLLEQDGLSYRRISLEEKPRPDLSASNVLVEYMGLRRGRPFIRETVENDRDSFYSLQHRKFCETCLDTLREISADFVIPFYYDGKVVGFCAVTAGDRILLSNEQLRLFIPVSRQVALQLKNAQTFRHLRDQDKLAAMGELAAGLAHEVKNPLGAIRGAAELLQSEKLSGQSLEFLKVITDETDRLSSVLTDFLDYAKPRKTDLKSSCDPLKVIEHTVALIPRESKAKIEIVNESKNSRLLVDVDPEGLKQILLNLFLNSIQALSGQESGTLRIAFREIRPKTVFNLTESLPLFKKWEGWKSLGEKHKPYLEIEVSDNGPGIPEEELPRIFLPFYTTKTTGTGLGLAICQRLVDGMGGNITVRANQPQGTVFTLHLPLKRDETLKMAISQTSKIKVTEG